MLLVSIYSGPHDAAVCVLKDGEVLLNLELERFSRTKKAGGMPLEFVNYCLGVCGIRDQEIAYQY